MKMHKVSRRRSAKLGGNGNMGIGRACRLPGLKDIGRKRSTMRRSITRKVVRSERTPWDRDDRGALPVDAILGCPGGSFDASPPAWA